MLNAVPIALDEIYVPVKRRQTLDKLKVETLATDILDNGLKLPIHVRRDKERYVLVEGRHRLEAARALGEASIEALIVNARQH